MRIIQQWIRGARVEPVGVAMPGPRFPQRLLRIIESGLAPRISRARMCLLIVACAVICSAFVMGTLARARQSGAAAAAGTRPKFEVASVKPCQPGELGSGGRGGKGGTPPPQWSPGRLTVVCQPAKFFISEAYAGYADGVSHSDRPPLMTDLRALSTSIEGAPSWVNSERFTISAEVPGDASREMMMGPMMQSLLEDRFQLKLHTETRSVSGYDLTVAKGGPKLPQKDSDVACRRMDPNNRGQRIGPAQEPDCTMQFKAITMEDFAQLLRMDPSGLDHPVVDKTGIKGTFEIAMVWKLDPSNFPLGVPEQPADTPDLFTALKDQVGLQLVPAKEPKTVLVVDHIEEPTAN